MESNGTTAGATASADATDLLIGVGTARHGITIINEGAAGFASVDNGNVWFRLPTATSTFVPADEIPYVPKVKIKRDGATDMSGVWCWFV